MLTRQFKSSKTYEKNVLKAKTSQVCVVCGKDVKDPPGYIHLIKGGSLVLHPSDEEKFLIKVSADKELELGDMGLHPVGSSCAQQYQGWLFIFQDEETL